MRGGKSKLVMRIQSEINLKIALIEHLDETEFGNVLGRTPTFFLSGAKLLEAKKPIVYLWVRGSEILYVGQSSQGLARVFSKHEYIDEIQPDDAVLAWHVEPGTELAVESWLINALQPKRNRAVGGATLARKRINEAWRPVIAAARRAAGPND